MFLGDLKDGGLFYIDNDTIKKWQLIYKNVDVVKILDELILKGNFKNLSKRSALKLINKTLKEQNEKL